MRQSLLLLSSALVSVLLVMPAQAQNAPSPDSSRAEIARIDVRFAALEERLRKMQGHIEEVEFENRRLREKLDLFQQDAELRFSELESGANAADATTSAPPASATSEDFSSEPEATATVPSTEKQVLRMPDKEKSGDTSFESSRDHYNHAFRLLNQTQYDEAGASFQSFIESYPKDPLVGNAYYWAGETYYVRQNYKQAADYFRRGYEAMPAGPKAGDNLLKLAMTLSAMDRKTEACVVLKQVSAKFGGNSATLRNKSDTERKRIGCK